MSALAEAARRLAAHGWRVLPLTPRGKRPLVEDWLNRASADCEQIAQWWSENPDNNIGLVPALSGLVVFDMDGPEAEATATFLGLTAEPTLAVVTGRTDFPGRHLYYQAGTFTCGNLRLAVDGAQLRSVSGERPGLEVKSAAGQVVVPPSIHPSGRLYRWAGKLADLRPLPAGAAEAMTRLTRTAPSRSPIGESIPAGSRDATLFSLAGALRRRGAGAAVILTALHAINDQHCDPPLDPRDLQRIAKSVSRYQPADSLADHYRRVVGV